MNRRELPDAAGAELGIKIVPLQLLISCSDCGYRRVLSHKPASHGQQCMCTSARERTVRMRHQWPPEVIECAEKSALADFAWTGTRKRLKERLIVLRKRLSSSAIESRSRLVRLRLLGLRVADLSTRSTVCAIDWPCCRWRFVLQKI